MRNAHKRINYDEKENEQQNGKLKINRTAKSSPPHLSRPGLPDHPSKEYSSPTSRIQPRTPGPIHNKDIFIDHVNIIKLDMHIIKLKSHKDRQDQRAGRRSRHHRQEAEALPAAQPEMTKMITKKNCREPADSVAGFSLGRLQAAAAAAEAMMTTSSMRKSRAGRTPKVRPSVAEGETTGPGSSPSRINSWCRRRSMTRPQAPPHTACGARSFAHSLTRRMTASTGTKSWISLKQSAVLYCRRRR